MNQYRGKTIKNKKMTDVAFAVESVKPDTLGGYDLSGAWLNIVDPDHVFHIGIVETINVHNYQIYDWELYSPTRELVKDVVISLFNRKPEPEPPNAA